MLIIRKYTHECLYVWCCKKAKWSIIHIFAKIGGGNVWEVCYKNDITMTTDYWSFNSWLPHAYITVSSLLHLHGARSMLHWLACFCFSLTVLFWHETEFKNIMKQSHKYSLPCKIRHYLYSIFHTVKVFYLIKNKQKQSRSEAKRCQFAVRKHQSDQKNKKNKVQLKLYNK